VSVYSPEELHAALGRLPIDTVQAPVSAVDRRFLAESLWARIADGAIELEARSVLLQGVLSSRERPLQFQPWQVQLEAWDDFVMDHGGDHTAVAVAVVLGSTRVARIVVGAEAPTQLRSWARAGDITIDPGDRFGCADEDLIDPRRWRPWE
jgi:aryl-alcohol dehydrogenase-like predicted oxidoreductase